MQRKIRTIGIGLAIGLLPFLWSGEALAYTADSITDWEPVADAPSVSIAMDLPIVGDNNLDQVEGLPSSTSFYKPIGIDVAKIRSYYISVFLDCSTLSGADKTKCEAGNLLTSSGNTLGSVSSAKTFSTMSNEWGFRYNIGSSAQDPNDKYFVPLPTDKVNGYLQYNGAEQIRTNGLVDHKVLTLGFGAKVDGNTAAGTYNGKVTVAVVANPINVVTMGDITYMQQVTPQICSNTSLGEYALKDSRDGKVYKVAKLADNECWMMQNLALEGGKKIDSDDSDLPSGADYTLPTGTGQMYNGTHKDNKYNNNTASTDGASDGTGDNTGAFYQWNVATAGYDATNSLDTGEADKSICPKGWTLPRGGADGGQFGKLYQAYGSNKARFDAAWHPGYVGIAGGGSISAHGDHEYTWSRTIGGTSTAYNMQDYISLLYPNGGGAAFRTYQFSVRCVAKETRTMDELTYMQDMNGSVCANTPTYDSTQDNSYALKDKRDDKSYKVAKLADGNCWMVQNLALDSGETEATRRTITGADSDLASASDTYKLPVSSTSGWTDNTVEYMYNGTHKDNKYDNNKANSNGSSDGTGDNTGAYYSWLTATANSGAALTSGDAPYSICPKGWKLQSRDKLNTLSRAYATPQEFGDAWHKGYVGGYYEDKYQWSGTYGYAWTSGALANTEQAYRLGETNGNEFYSSVPIERRAGLPIRCVY